MKIYQQGQVSKKVKRRESHIKDKTGKNISYEILLLTQIVLCSRLKSLYSILNSVYHVIRCSRKMCCMWNDIQYPGRIKRTHARIT